MGKLKGAVGSTGSSAPFPAVVMTDPNMRANYGLVGPMAIREAYPLRAPYSYAAIGKDPESGGLRYHVIEPTLTEEELRQLERIKEILVAELDVDARTLGSRSKAEEYLQEKVLEVVKNYKLKVWGGALKKLMYYITRDFLRLGKIDPLMHDHLIEDISCDGVGVPIYVWHREHESIPTNIIFDTEQELTSFITKLAYLSGRHISIATPIVDGSLPDGSRVQLTYGREVTKRGSTFSIRRFRADPITVTDLVAFNTLSAEVASYFWFIIERKASILITGGTASGKTTTMNALSMFIHPDYKIISIEDTAELNLPHENWIPSVSRTGFGVAGGPAEISLFNLLKAALRQRPDYILVGEVRGEEAYTLFQAIATGHGGISSIHADSPMAAINRLESEPMNVPRPLITQVNVIALQSKVRVGERSVRRMAQVSEIVPGRAPTGEVVFNDVFLWDPKADTFRYGGRSYIVESISERYGLDPDWVNQELARRRTVVEWMVKTGVRRYRDVGAVIRSYYNDPEKTYSRARLELYS